MTHFAIFIPDWNSLESVRRAHSDLEGAALVFFALLVLFDVLSHFSDDKRRERLFEKIGLCFFGIAVLAEILAYPYGQRNDSLSEQLIGSLDAKARQASSDASQAITDSGTALSQAKDALRKTGAAEGAMKNAANEAMNARTAASSALSIAHDARTEADSFEKDIVSAKQQSADAESHLADALRQAANATEQLNRIKTPRSLTRVPELISTLEPFKGTEFVFESVFHDEESVYLLRSIDDLLQKAGWKRGKSVAGFPGIDIYGSEERNFAVPVGFNIGIKISTDSPKPLEHLESTTLKDFPLYIQAAGTLNFGLSQCIVPLQGNSVGKLTSVETGPSTTIRIAIGRKP